MEIFFLSVSNYFGQEKKKNSKIQRGILNILKLLIDLAINGSNDLEENWPKRYVLVLCGSGVCGESKERSVFSGFFVVNGSKFSNK